MADNDTGSPLTAGPTEDYFGDIMADCRNIVAGQSSRAGEAGNVLVDAPRMPALAVARFKVRHGRGRNMR
ncbi:hypothetical protein GCM10029992_43110 [Glycomyces albus]